PTARPAPGATSRTPVPRAGPGSPPGSSSIRRERGACPWATRPSPTSTAISSSTGGMPRAADVLSLAEELKERVFRKFGVRLEEEVIHLRADASML
ncbi:MAG: hypothetical protein MZV63_64375, partial [Marinilabiliales bacterium]|nr:hypothetical protein [Marinilabiliales bacterium]